MAGESMDLTPGGFKLDIKKVCDDLETDGYAIVRNFLNSDQVEKIRAVMETPHRINSNELTYVHNNNSEFFSNALAFSKDAFDIVASPGIRAISRSFLGEHFRLKCHRVYNTHFGFEHPWHTDNKVMTEKTDSRGLAFIIYLQDTEDGATEFVPGSHKFSMDYDVNVFSGPSVQEKWGDKVRQAHGKAGDLMLSDIRTIHRGSHWKKRGSSRRSFWFQVDSNVDDAERLLLNPAFLPNDPDAELRHFLGFGLSGGLDVHPIGTGIRTYPLRPLLSVVFQSIMALILFPALKVRRSLPERFKIFMRKVLGRNTWG